VIDRRTFGAFAGGSLLLIPLAIRAQTVPKRYRIGYLDPRSPRITADDPSYTTLRRTLGDLGYIDGKTMIFEERFADRKLDRLPELAAELVQLKVDVIIAASGYAIAAARGATTTIPIVMAFSGDDPVKSGFVASLARPGGNTTGVAILFSEIAPKWVQYLREVVPGMSRLAVLANPLRPAHGDYLAVLQAQRPPDVRLQRVEAAGPDEYDAAFAAMRAGRAEAVIILADVLFTQDATRLAQLAARGRLPSIYQFREFPVNGGLMAYGPDERDLSAIAAQHVDRLLRGAVAGELPVQQPTKFNLVLNLATGKAIGATIPKSLQALADEVIQ
jgi:putative ABC transport system substrate-binding protein